MNSNIWSKLSENILLKLFDRNSLNVDITWEVGNNKSLLKKVLDSWKWVLNDNSEKNREWCPNIAYSKNDISNIQDVTVVALKDKENYIKTIKAGMNIVLKNSVSQDIRFWEWHGTHIVYEHNNDSSINQENINFYVSMLQEYYKKWIIDDKEMIIVTYNFFQKYAEIVLEKLEKNLENNFISEIYDREDFDNNINVLSEIEKDIYAMRLMQNSTSRKMSIFEQEFAERLENRSLSIKALFHFFWKIKKK